LTPSPKIGIMVGRFQPYLYNAPVEQSTYNPKAVTMASRLPPPPPRKKPSGPLIDFNKHPDSYLILPYGNTNAKPMNKKTKVYVKVARWIQLSLRVCTLLGAVGVLLCGIFIRGVADTEGYIMRIPVRASQHLHRSSLTYTARCRSCHLSLCCLPPHPQRQIPTRRELSQLPLLRSRNRWWLHTVLHLHCINVSA
jgi:hypothetical protein